jgi:alkylation response protein AidB-like acyl-CoA dehydrogenase
MDLSGERPWWPLGDIDQMGEAMRHWIGQRWSPELTVGEWWQRLAVAGLTAPTWPRAHGGLAATTVVQRVIEHELAEARTVAPPVDNLSFRVVAPAIRQFATGAQLSEWIPPILCGTTLWALAVAEADVDHPADLTCRVDIDWKYLTIDGCKLRSEHTVPTHALVLARSGGGGRGGLTALAVDLATEGVRLEDDIIRFEQVRLPLDSIVGSRDNGWAVWTSAKPYLDRSLAGRIRRGLVRVEPGAAAGQLGRRVGEVVADHRSGGPPGADRRASDR